MLLFQACPDQKLSLSRSDTVQIRVVHCSSRRVISSCYCNDDGGSSSGSGDISSDSGDSSSDSGGRSSDSGGSASASCNFIIDSGDGSSSSSSSSNSIIHNNNISRQSVTGWEPDTQQTTLRPYRRG